MSEEAVLAFIDAIMKHTVAGHEKLCDENKCSVENPCPYCKINDIMMEEMKKLDE